MDLHCTEGALRKIADIALKKNTGARGLRSIFEKLLTSAMFVVPDSSCHTVLLDEAAVMGTRRWNHYTNNNQPITQIIINPLHI